MLKDYNKEKIVFLVGPTGVGKTQISLELAQSLNSEIIGCDSMQVYRGMDLISCKVSKSIREKISHHLLDIVSAEEEFNVADWVDLALKAIKDIYGRKKIPLIVGGSMLYMSCLLDGIFTGGESDRSIRNSLYKEAEKFGRNFLYRRLENVDLQAAKKIHPNDLKRIVRALEVYEIYRMPISVLQKNRKPITDLYNVRIFGLIRPRKKIYERIDKRVEGLFEDGLVDEVRNLIKLNLSKTASQVIGVREIKGYLDREYDLNEAKRLISKNTRNYARRQMSWFRRDKRIEWIEIKDNEDAKAIAKKISDLFYYTPEV